MEIDYLFQSLVLHYYYRHYWLAGALIQTVITFKIMKSYMGFCILLITHDLSFRLFSLELSNRSQTSEIRV